MRDDEQARSGRDQPHAVAAASKRLTVDLPRDVHRRLKTLAAHQEVTMADVLRRVLAEWLEREDTRSPSDR